MIDGSNPGANLPVHAMVTIKGLLPNNKDVSKTVDLDIVLIVDKSRSMEGNRMETMKNLILHLINSVLKENHRLGKNIERLMVTNNLLTCIIYILKST